MKSSIDKRAMSTDDWLRARKKGIGASEIAAVMGISKYRTSYDVWLDKTSDEVSSLPDTWRLFIGREAEEPVAKYYHLQTGREVRRDNKIRMAAEYPFIIANLDRVVLPLENEVDGRSGPGILECKITDTLAAKNWDAEYPLEYFCQVQQQLLVTGYAWGDLAIGIGTSEFVSFLIRPNKDFQKEMIAKCVEFWGYVERKEEPPKVAVDLEKIRSLIGSGVEASKEVLGAHASLLICRSKMSEIKAEAKGFEDQIKEYLGENELLTYGEKLLASWKSDAGRIFFDAKRLEAEKPKIYKLFLKHSKPSRRFLVKGGEAEETD